MSGRLQARAAGVRAGVGGATAILLSAGCCAYVAAAPAAASAKQAAAGCSLHGLSFTEKKGSFTLADDVAKLRARDVSCTSARTLARTVAKDLLKKRKVPREIGGLVVTLKEPCKTCTPDTKVRAHSGSKLVTFTVQGGATR